MLPLATSYEGLLLLLQMPISSVCALVAFILLFRRKARSLSAGFAIAGILITLLAVALELQGYGVHSLTRSRDGAPGFLCLVFLPMFVSGVVLIYAIGGRPGSK
jgi:hypothetical protein